MRSKSARHATLVPPCAIFRQAPRLHGALRALRPPCLCRASTSQVARAKGAPARLILRERDDRGSLFGPFVRCVFRGDRKQGQARRLSRECAIGDSNHGWKLGRNEEDNQLRGGGQSPKVSAVLRFASNRRLRWGIGASKHSTGHLVGFESHEIGLGSSALGVWGRGGVGNLRTRYPSSRGHFTFTEP